MSSQAQVNANQINAKSSTGPRTDSGKTASALNGLTHGLSSTFRLLPNEDQRDYDHLASSIRAELQPNGDHENFLTDLMIQSRWRIIRIMRLEGAAFDLMLNPDAAPESADAKIVTYMAQRKSADVLNTLQRYLASAERLYSKCYRELLHARHMAQKMYDKAIEIEIKKIKSTGIGFASHNGHAPAAQQQTTTPAAPENPPAKKQTLAESLGNLALRL
ncbi:MAG: hypothetical protein JO022_02045 [Acidobacteriaceae bacterium]|nr:hypothetical protein [Acidobacteriaceae bacterium]